MNSARLRHQFRDRTQQQVFRNHTPPPTSSMLVWPTSWLTSNTVTYLTSLTQLSLSMYKHTRTLKAAITFVYTIMPLDVKCNYFHAACFALQVMFSSFTTRGICDVPTWNGHLSLLPRLRSPTLMLQPPWRYGTYCHAEHAMEWPQPMGGLKSRFVARGAGLSEPHTRLACAKMLPQNN